MGYYSQFPEAIPLSKVGYVRVTHPCATRQHQFRKTNLLPFDLHVLSLPLAFILSQDQTLHCKVLSWLLKYFKIIKNQVLFFNSFIRCS